MSHWHKNTRRMHTLRDEFFNQGKQADANDDTRHTSTCWICGQRIDYYVPAGTTDDSHELDHATPVSQRPDLQEDPNNFRHAHKRCNRERSDSAPHATLGTQVPDWW